MGEPMSAFSASASQHLATVGSSHSFTETVFLFTMPLLGLIRTKHIVPSFRETVFCEYSLYNKPVPNVKPFFIFYFSALHI